MSYDIHHGALECIAKDTESTDCWDVCAEKLGILLEQQQLFLRCGSREESQQAVWVSEERQRVCVSNRSAEGLKDLLEDLRRQIQEKITRAPGVDRQFLAS